MNSVNNVAFSVQGGCRNVQTGRAPACEQDIKQALSHAASLGYERLKQGDSATEVVSRVIAELENTPGFNAGKGSALTEKEMVEMDAFIMAEQFAAVSGIRHVQNPVRLVQALLKQHPNTMMYADGAEAFAYQNGFEYTEQDYFFTDERYEELMSIKRREDFSPSSLEGMVSAVALDQHHDLAVAASSGGHMNRRPGLIGSPAFVGGSAFVQKPFAIIAHSDDDKGLPPGVSAVLANLLTSSGVGSARQYEQIMRVYLQTLKSKVSLMAMDQQGHIVNVSNGAGVYRASVDRHGELTIKIDVHQ